MSEQRTETVKRADALETGDHIIEVAQYGKPPQPLKVLFAHPFRDGDRRPMVALMLDAPTKIDGFSPLDLRVPVDAKFEMADEQDLAVYRDAGRRLAFATGLRQLADAIEVGRLPVPRYGAYMSGCLESRAELEVWAEHLGVEIKAGGTDGTIPVVDKDVSAPEDGPTLNVRWQAPGEPKPAPEPEQLPEVEPEQEWLFTFGAGHKHEGHFVRITGTHASARARMVEVFGTEWCAAYTWRAFDQEGLAAKLTELPDGELADAILQAAAALDAPTVPAQRSGE